MINQPDRRCALCGHQPSPAEDADGLRALGAEPLTILVCRDLSGCVTRYHRQAAQPEAAAESGRTFPCRAGEAGDD